MNTRSLKFRLIVWYAGLLAACFVVLGAGAYVALDNYLTRALGDSLNRRGRQIEQILAKEAAHHAIQRVGPDIDSRYAPSANDRFVRVSSQDGKVLFESATPASQDFSPESLPAPARPARNESVSKIDLITGKQMLIARRVAQIPNAGSFLIETGAPMNEVQADLRQWLWMLAAGLPLVVIISVIGGYLLIKRALAPVDQITSSAERISYRNLAERLPVAKTGDELERLSTSLNLMIARLEDAFQNARRFMADASHELRTPLTVLRGELESLAGDDSELRPELRQRLGAALEELERLVNIVEGLLALSRLDAGEAQAEWVKFDLAALASATADQMSLLAEDKGIKLACAPAREVWIEGNRARIKQIIVNLLDNAIKYTQTGGAVGVSVSSWQGKAVLEIADNGPGIPADALPHVFERFYRVDNARSREVEGVGLGLSIVKSICTAHHGTVHASSRPGQGSTFRVELPLAQANTPSVPDPRAKTRNHAIPVNSPEPLKYDRHEHAMNTLI